MKHILTFLLAFGSIGVTMAINPSVTKQITRFQNNNDLPTVRMPHHAALNQNQAADDDAFKYEPTEKTDIQHNFVAIETAVATAYVSKNGNNTLVELYFYDKTAGFDLAFFVDELDEQNVIPVGTYPINQTQKSGSVFASPGTDDEDEDLPSYYFTDFTPTGSYNKSYYLHHGTVSVGGIDGGTGIAITVDAYSYFGSTIHISYSGAIVVYDPYAIEKEFEQGTFTEVMTEAEYEVETDGQVNLVYLYLMNATAEADLALILPQLDAKTILPAGTYPINATYQANTVVASAGDFTPSAFLIDSDNAYGISLYYLVDGSLTVTVANEIPTFTLKATSYYGSEINVTYTGNLAGGDTAVEQATSNTLDTARKVMENGNIYILRDNVKYNVLGARVEAQ